MRARARILVEGPDDKNVCRHLLSHHWLEVEIKEKEDVSLASRWQSLRDTLLNCAYQSIPLVPSAEGTVIVEPDRVVLGFWIMPDNRMDGILENFVAQLIPERDQLWPKAQADVAAIPVQDCCFKLQDRPKAEICTWLAWQHEPGVKMGSAINRAYLRADSPAAQSFVAWMRRFMETAPPE